MKKITLLFASLFIAMGAMAQTAVTDLSQLGNDKKYFIESARCFLMYKPTASETKLCTSNAIAGDPVEKKMADEAQQFNIISEGGNYYLYSIGAGKFVSKDGSFVETKSDALTLENVGGNYPWKLCIGGNGLNSQIPGQMTEGIVVNSWTSADAGNCYQIIDVPADYVDPVYVSALADFDPTKAYTLTTKQRGAWTVNNELTELSTTTDAGQSVDATDTKQHFAVLTLDNVNYYLFNVAANKFVKSKYDLVAAKGTPIQLNDATSEGANRMQIQYVGDADGYFNIGGSKQRDICDWSAIDHGNAVLFTEIADFDPTEALEMLAKETANVTYNFILNGKTIHTQTDEVAIGGEYPNFKSVTMPIGVTLAEAKPEGNVTEDATIEITLAADDSKIPFAFVAEGTPTTWYYAQIHSNNKKYICVNGENQATWENTEVAEAEMDNCLWGFVGNIYDGFKMVNKAGNYINAGSPATVGEGGTSYIVMPSSAVTENAFCMLNNGNYMNAQSGFVKQWSANDAGSTITLIDYEEQAVSVSEAGWATMYLGYQAYIPEGVNVYAVTGVEDGYVTKSLIEGVIPANTGVLLENAGNYTFKRAAKNVAALEGNLLNGSVENTYVEGTAYVLADGDNGVGMYLAVLNKDAEGNDGETHFLNNAGKAYMVLPAASETVAFFGFDWAGTTGIEKVEVENTGVIYDLTGRQVNAVERGIYIINGKKVLVK